MSIVLCWMSVLGALFLSLIDKAASRKAGNHRAVYPVLATKACKEEKRVEIAERKAA